MTIENDFDLTSRVASYFDPHMVLPLLDFAEETGIYSDSSVQAARLKLLESTSMVDFYNELCTELHGEQAMRRSREDVLNRFTILAKKAEPALSIINDPEKFKQLREMASSKTGELLCSYFGVLPTHLNALYCYARLNFDSGRYHDAAEQLFAFRVFATSVVPIVSSAGEAAIALQARCTRALWGQLAADILLTHWDDALAGITMLGDTIDAMPVTAEGSQLAQLKARTWLIHWSLFVFFNHRNGRASLIELFTKERYMNAIQTSCPHILRYLSTAVIISQCRRNVLNDLVKIISSLQYIYSDPITSFLHAVYHDNDFDTARQMLTKCDSVLSADFFLLYIKDEFVESARVFYFETYCRVHNAVSLRVISDMLQRSGPEAEAWIVNLIRSVGLDARIDSATSNVIMEREYPSVYQKIIDKTRSLTFRTNQLVGMVDKKYAVQSAD